MILLGIVGGITISGESSLFVCQLFVCVVEDLVKPIFDFVCDENLKMSNTLADAIEAAAAYTGPPLG